MSWKKKNDQGTIVLVNSIFLQIKWDNGKISCHRHDGMQGIILIKARQLRAGVSIGVRKLPK